MLGLLGNEGYDIVPEIEEAETVIINTCGFIQPAVEETIDTVLAAVKKKKAGVVKRIFVTGCFVQRYGKKLLKEIPEVDGWLGTGEITRIVELVENSTEKYPPLFINRPVYLADHRLPRLQTTPHYSAYMKIAEGCSSDCSYCKIPALRGPFRSRDVESLIEEARQMADKGVIEVNLIAQDTTLYGKDLKNKTGIEDLLENLALVQGLRWIRLLYSHPARVSPRLLELIENEEKICPYLDLPFQHVNKSILKAMKRPVTMEEPIELIDRIRAVNRDISIRTTLMVGFPGENEKRFEEMSKFVKKARFDHLGVFVYCREKGTPAANLPDSIEQSTAEERRNIILEIQSKICQDRNSSMIGKTVPVLVEGESDETDLLLKGRTAGMAPEVDGQVLINDGFANRGDIVKVGITEAHPYDLVGAIIDS